MRFLKFFILVFGAAVSCKNIQQTQKDILPKKFLKTLNLFCQPGLPVKKETK